MEVSRGSLMAYCLAGYKGVICVLITAIREQPRVHEWETHKKWRERCRWLGRRWSQCPGFQSRVRQLEDQATNPKKQTVYRCVNINNWALFVFVSTTGAEDLPERGFCKWCPSIPFWNEAPSKSEKRAEELGKLWHRCGWLDRFYQICSIINRTTT